MSKTMEWFDDNATLLTRLAWFIKNVLPESAGKDYVQGDHFVSLSRASIIPLTILKGLNGEGREVEKAFLISTTTGAPMGEIGFWNATETGLRKQWTNDPPNFTVVHDMVRGVLFEVKYRFYVAQIAICKDKVYLITETYTGR